MDEHDGGGVLPHPPSAALPRIMLTTDATLVLLLEAWFDDPIHLAGHEQVTTAVYPTDEELEPAGDETILRRRVLLRGRRTGRNYVYADTAIVLDRLAEPMRDALLSTSEPIGRLLRTHRTETFREVLRSGNRPAGAVGAEFGIGPSDDLLYRVYRMVSGGQPVMLVTEHFPARPVPAAHEPPTPSEDVSEIVDLRDERADVEVSRAP